MPLSLWQLLLLADFHNPRGRLLFQRARSTQRELTPTLTLHRAASPRVAECSSPECRVFLNNLYMEDPHFGSKYWRPMNRLPGGSKNWNLSCGDVFENTKNYGYQFSYSGQGI